MDSDLVEVSNLQRQTIHGGNIGFPKAKSAESFVRSLNNDVNVVTYEERFSADD